MKSDLILCLLLFPLATLMTMVNGFIACPAGGRRLCANNEIPYNLTTTNNFALSNCVYENCPQIIVDSCTGLTITNVTFRNGNGTANLYNGGALAIVGNTYQSQVTIRNSRFENIFSGAAGANMFQGGAIYATGTVLIYDTAFVNNSAVDQGGAIMAFNPAGLNCTRCVFTGNSASCGGAISINQPFANNSTFLYFMDSVMDQNKAILRFGTNAFGGSIYIIGTGKLYVKNSTISNGYSSALAAGIYATGSSTILNLQSVTAISNTASNSGFLHFEGVSGCQITVQNSVFLMNWADLYGGAIRLIGNIASVIDSCQFTSNHGRYGTSIYLSRVLPTTVRNCIFDSEYSVARGSIYFESVTVLFDNCIFRNCHCDAFGGAISSDLASGRLTLTNSQFINNTATNYGGVAYLGHSGTMTVQNCSFSNSSSSIGGAIYVQSSPFTLAISDSTFSGNKAVKFGGDLYVYAGVVSTITRCSFSFSYSGIGGSHYFQDALVTITGSKFSNCLSEQYGGSIYTYKSSGSPTFSLSNSQFSYSSSIAGGSISIIGHAGNFNNVSFVGSVATRYGGSIYATGSTINIINCNSVASSALTGGFLYTITESISITGSTISGSKAILSGGSISVSASQVTCQTSQFVGTNSANGGFIELELGSSFTGAGVQISNSTANFGGAVYLQASQFSCDTCSMTNFNAPSNGSLLYVNGGSQATMTNCQVNNNPGATSGSFIFSRGSTVSVVNMNVAYLSGVTGSFLDAIEGSSCSFSAVQVINPVATGVGGSIVLVEGTSIVSFENSVFTYPKAEIIFAVNSGSDLTITACILSFSGLPMLPSSILPDWYNQINNYVFKVTFDSSLEFISYSSIDSFAGMNVALIAGIFTCQTSIVSNSNTTDSAFSGQSTSQLSFSGCSIINSRLSGSVNPCNFGQGVSSYGGAISSSGLVSITDATLLQGNVAHYGGAIAITGAGSLSIGSNVNISGNVALLYGGAFYLDSPSPNLINGDSVFISNNYAPNFPQSNCGYFGNGYLDIDPSSSPLNGNNLTLNGGIYVFNHLVAESISQNSSIINLNGAKWGGRAKKLRLVAPFTTSGMTIKLTLSQDIPVLTVAAVNGFNQIATVDPSSLVIVEVNEINMNATLKGETIKSIIDASTGMATLNSLSVQGRVAGTYTLQIRAKEGTLDFDGIDPNPLILNVIYRDCAPGSELYVASINSCVPIQKINGAIRITLIIICVTLIIGCVLTLVGLFKFREFHLIKANSYVYLSVPVLGCVLAFLGPILNSVSCIVSTAVENIGFTLIFSSLLIKLYRIRVIFGRDDVILSKEAVRSLKDSSLAKILYVGLAITLTYEVLWGVLGDPSPVPTYIPDLGVVISDQCRLDSSFALGMAALKFIVSIIVSYLAYINRNVPSDFNEAKYIGFSCYNWVIFGTFISLTSQFIITNPNVALLVKGLSLVLSHAYTTLYLASYKVYMCWRFPQATKTQIKSKIVSSVADAGTAKAGTRTNNISTTTKGKAISGVSASAPSNETTTNNGSMSKSSEPNSSTIGTGRN